MCEDLASLEQLQGEISKLRQELAETRVNLSNAEETLRAIHAGEVDAVIISTEQGVKVFTLQGADYVYQCLVEQMGQGAATVSTEGLVLYANKQFAELLGFSLKKLIGSKLEMFIAPKDRGAFLRLFENIKGQEIITKELSLITANNGDEIPVQFSLRQLNIDNFWVNSIVITDITESKIRESTKLNQVLNQAIAAITSYRAFPDGTWISDYWSEGCEQLFGYSAAELIADQNLWSSHVFPEDLKHWMEETFEDYHLNRKSYVEYRFYHKDGSVRWLAAAQILEWDEVNHWWNGTGVLTDITRRKQAEICQQEQMARERLVTNIANKIRETLDLDQVLQSTVEQIQALLKADRVVIFRFNHQGKGTIIAESIEGNWESILTHDFEDQHCVTDYLNNSTKDFYARTDILQSPLAFCLSRLFAQIQVRASLTVPIFRAQRLWGYLIVHQCSNTREWQITEIELLQKLAIQVSIAIQQSELYQKSCQELQDRQKAERKIIEQASLIDIATDAIFVHDLEHRILFWSKGAERLYGWTEAEVLGKKSLSLFNQKADLSKEIEMAIAVGNWTGELEQVTKNGKKIIIESRRTLVNNEFLRSKSILVVNSDITGKKELEKQFYHAQRLDSLGTLASGIAHDFNNILAPILGASQLLALNLSDVDEQTQKLLQLLSSSAQRGSDLVKQILLFSRATEGEIVVLQLGYVLQELISIAQQTFPKSIEISENIPTKQLWNILADATRMHQVFLNLMVNARDAMPDGGKLMIQAENCQLNEQEQEQILEAKQENYLVVTITDTGMGIAPELLDKIFNPFFTTKEVGRGTGLGLSTVIGIVKDHGGFVQVHSEVGKGTEFKIFFPAIAEQIHVSTVEKDILPRGQGELILIVDDEPFIRDVMRISLERYGYRTMLASDGLEAIALYEKHQGEISLVLMDMMMPHLDGATTIRMLQAINASLKVIIMTGLLDSKKTGLNEDTQLFLPKPCSIKQLLTTLQEILSSEDD